MCHRDIINCVEGTQLRGERDEHKIDTNFGRPDLCRCQRCFPDGAVWLKVTDALPTFARLMRIRATAMRDMNDFMLLAQLVEAVRHQTDVLVSHLDLPAAVGASGQTYGIG